jgi:hypothetical protein
MGRFAVFALVAAALAAGCGAEDAAREAVDPVADAAARTAAAGGAQVDGVITYEIEGERIPSTMTGVVDFENGRSRVVTRFRAFGAKVERESGFPDERIRDGLAVYITTPLLRDEIDERWAKVDLEEMSDEYGLDAEMLGSWDESSPQSMLRVLEAAGGARDAGRKRIGGELTTRYDAQISIERFAELVAKDADPDFRRGFVDGITEQMGSDTVATSVWIDGDGLIRRERMEMTMNIEGESIDATLLMSFSDFSDRHEVAVPDEGDVKDVTLDWDRYKVHFTG